MNWLKKEFGQELWSPYMAGILLGIVGVMAVWLSNSLLGASGAFETIAGALGKAFAPDLFSNMYFNFIMPPGNHLGCDPADRRVLRRHARRGDQRHVQAGARTMATATRSGKASSDRRSGSAGCWHSWARSFWNMPPGSPAAAPAAWPSPAACCWLRRPSCSSPGCSPPASSPR